MEFDTTIAGNDHVLRRHRDRQRHSLEQIEGKDGQRVIVLEKDQSVIGRSTTAHIRVRSDRASRQHAILKIHGTDCTLYDNDSDNGVFLNGVRIHSAVLRDGDIIQLADSAFIYNAG